MFTVGYVDTIDSSIDCVKGRSYHLDEFLLGKKDPIVMKQLLDGVAKRGNTLYFCVIYLSPGTYHRFNSPVHHTAVSRRHIPGNLKLVRPSNVEKHKEVFFNNERVNVFGQFYGQKNFFM